jgi:hypothetical protein
MLKGEKQELKKKKDGARFIPAQRRISDPRSLLVKTELDRDHSHFWTLAATWIPFFVL